MKKQALLLSLVVSIFILFLVGCSKDNSTTTNSSKTISYNNETYTVPKNPKRIVVLSNSLLSMLHAIQVDPIGRVTTSDTLPTDLESIPSVGHTANINMEQLLALKPDEVLGLQSQHSKYKDQLQANQIPSTLINYDGIKDNIPLITFLGELTNHEEQAKQVTQIYTKQMNAVHQAIQGKPSPTIAVLRATGKGVTAETPTAIAASMVKELHMTNVVANHLKENTTDKTVPYSLETLTQDNPDIIFIVTMGKEAEITKAMEKDMTNNPAWSHLAAVQNHKVIYLPSNLFLLNPGLQTPQAMARLVHDAYDITVQF